MRTGSRSAGRMQRRKTRNTREFVAQTDSWVRQMPVRIGRHYLEGPFFEKGLAPLSLDAGIRMAQAWWPAYHYFKDSPSFAVESQFRMLRSFLDHAHYLMHPGAFHGGNNWGRDGDCGPDASRGDAARVQGRAALAANSSRAPRGTAEDARLSRRRGDRTDARLSLGDVE